MPNELAEEWLDAGWGEWDIEDAYVTITDALDYVMEKSPP